MIRAVLKKKLVTQKGFTLTEMLVTILIVVMGTAVVATGVPAAAQAYRSFVDVANAQSLLSTTTTQLRDELALASDCLVSGNALAYRDKFGNDHTISLGSSSSEKVENELLYDGKPLALPGASAGADNNILYVTCGGISLTDTSDALEFSNINICGSESSAPLATASVYAVKIITPTTSS